VISDKLVTGVTEDQDAEITRLGDDLDDVFYKKAEAKDEKDGIARQNMPSGGMPEPEHDPKHEAELAAKRAITEKIVKELHDKYNCEIPQKAIDKIPEELLDKATINQRNDGIKWGDKHGRNYIRIDKADPSGYPHQRVDHVRINHNGNVIGRDGKPIMECDTVKYPANEPDAHIPYEEWIKDWKGAYTK
jgi:hypothetical protein